MIRSLLMTGWRGVKASGDCTPIAAMLDRVASLPEDRIIEIFQDGVKRSFQLKGERPDLPGRISKYCAFVMAARKGGWDTIKGKGYRVADQEQYDDFTHLRRATAATLVSRGRKPVLRRTMQSRLETAPTG